MSGSSRRPKGFPEIVEVGGARYWIAFARKLSDGDLGCCDPELKLIVISLDQSRQEMLATFWHECLHAMEFELGISLGHPKIRKLEYAVASVHQQLKDAEQAKEAE
jgi:hypothetical protein